MDSIKSIDKNNHMSTDELTIPAALIAKLREEGIKLWEEEGKLKFKAHKGVLTEDKLQQLKQQKIKVLELLKKENEAVSVVEDLENRHEFFPLTDVQAAYLLGRNKAFEYGGVACHLYLELNYEHLDPEKVEEVWNRMVKSHEMLRAEISPNGYQYIRESTPHFAVEVHHFAAESTEKTEAGLTEIREEMGNRMYQTDQWPLFGIGVSTTATKAVLHFSMEFLIADWASMLKIIHEFETRYFQPHQPIQISKLSFRDYLIAEQSLKNTLQYDKDKSYWKQRIPELPPAPKLPKARKEDYSSGKFIRRELRLNLASWNNLKQQAQKHGITPTVIVLTAYATVLERWSRNDHFCLNLTVLNRLPLHPEVNDIVGDFTSVSLLEVDFRESTEFTSLARNINTRLFEDLDHRLFTGIEVIREMTRQHGKESSLMPFVFTSAIGLNNVQQKLRGEVSENGISQTPQVFLDCQATDTSEGLLVNWDVRDGVFPDHLVSDMFEAFENLIHQLSSGDEYWEQSTPITLPWRQEQERIAANDTKAKLPTGVLHQSIESNIQSQPNAIAIIDPENTWNYRQLGLIATAVSEELKKLGCKPEERVAITIPKNAYQVAAVLGSLSAQATYVPIDVSQPADRRNKILQNASIRFALISTKSNVTFPEDIQTIEIDKLPLSEEVKLDANYSVEQPAYVIYTSGSTGEPKGVVISHKAARNTIEDINSRFEVSSKDSILALAQLGFDLSVYDLFGILAAGGKVIYPQTDRQTDPSHWLELMKDHQITLWDTVPALMQMMLTYLSSEKEVHLPAFRLALLSGDWIPLFLPDQLKQLLPGVQLISLGGATEAAIWSICHPYNGLASDWTSIPYGLPLANQGFRVLDKKWRDCPEWVVGELFITGDGLAMEYLGDEKMTKQRFFKHPIDGQQLYRTGDLGRYMPGGEIEFIGREDNQIKIRGHRIELGEIESVMQQHEAVGNVKVVVVDDTGQDRSLLAFVEPAVDKALNVKNKDKAFKELTAGIEDKARTQILHLNREAIENAVRQLDEAVFYSMLRSFQKMGFFSEEKSHSLEEIIKRDKILPRYHWLIGRWVSLLVDASLLEKQGENLIKTTINTTDQEENIHWDKARTMWTTANIGSPEFVEYVKSNALLLPDLLSGTQDPVELLFPEGNFKYAEAMYVKNAMTNYLNLAICELLVHIAKKKTGRFRILEIGAGIGATTRKVIEALKDYPVDYLFTDTVPAFVTNAKSNFSAATHMRFGVYDVDKDCRSQGLSPNSFDIIVAAGVLENAKNIPQALNNVKELLHPGGWFVFTEPTIEHPWILASQAFMMQEPQDDLRKYSSYLDRQSWYELTLKLGEGPVYHLPKTEDALSMLGIHLYATQVKKDHMYIDTEAMDSFMRNKLPSYMIPPQLQIVDALPLTGNGKVDIKQLKNWKVSLSNEGSSVQESENTYQSELEVKLAKMWAAALGLPSIGRDQNFYECGADSLIIAQMAGTLRDEFSAKGEVSKLPFDTLLREILNAPTVTDLAEFIRNHQGNVQSELNEHTTQKVNDNIGAYTHFGGGDSGPLRVIFPAGLGTMDCFRPLIEELKIQQAGPILGVSVADTDRYCSADPLELIEEVAEDYAAHLHSTGHQQVQIIGYCLGCMTAIEVARRLQEKDIEVSDLILIDGLRAPFIIQDELLVEAIYLPNMNISSEQTGFGSIDGSVLMHWFNEAVKENSNKIEKGDTIRIGGTDQLDMLGDVFRKMASYSLEERFDAYMKVMPATGEQKMPTEMVMRMFKTYSQSFQASSFEPTPYFGDIRYLQAEDGSYFLPGLSDQSVQFWSDVCLGEFSLGTIQGNHYSCIEPPNVKNVAKIVGEPLLAFHSK
ncbi:MAG: amino acid adenylation domain-containing protein [Bacteroidota bacterium]